MVPPFFLNVHLREVNGSWDVIEQTNKEKSTSVIGQIRAATKLLAAAVCRTSCCLQL